MYLRRRRIDLFLRHLSLVLVPQGNQRTSNQRKSKQRKSKQRKSSPRSGAGCADTLSSAGVLGSSWCCSSSSVLFGRWVEVAKRTRRARAVALLPPTVWSPFAAT